MRYPTARWRSPALLLPLALAASACATLPAAGPARGVPGFDTRDHPGAAAMTAWRESSPYRWVGFYLPAPCYTGTTWTGRRAELEAMGWGLAVLFVGEQDWGEIAGGDSPPPGTPDARCTRDNVTSERGALDAAAAASAAAAEGFPAGTVVYLNVERVESVSTRLLSYVRAWSEGLLQDGRFVPGLYAHERNAEPLHAAVGAAFALQGRSEAPRLWVASERGFDLVKAPAESPVPWASIWQGEFDKRETWGGVTLRIDVNVAWSATPSR